MAVRKVVRSLTTSGVTLPVLSGPPTAPVEADVAEVAAFGDASFSAVVSNCPKYGQITLKCLDEGASDPPVPGAAATLVVTTVYGDGSGSGDATRALSLAGQIVSVTPDEVEVGGNRVAAFAIVFQPSTGAAPVFKNAGG